VRDLANVFNAAIGRRAREGKPTPGLEPGTLRYEREDADDWIVQGVALALGVVGLVATAGATWRTPAARM
jgi:hypothetical protein